MSTWPLPPRLEPDDDLKAADLLLGKADALLKRHRVPDPQPPAPEEVVSLDDEDLPVLTEVVAPEDLSAELASPRPPQTKRSASELAEQLISLDTEVSRAVEAWFHAELPQIVARELDRLGASIREQALAHLRATLLPELSAHISRHLEKNTDVLPPDQA
ncbi:hypothetical protein [Aromatoleum petrolei]|uniref:DUF2497 domain-containing protein n=1 Tax=Aromatoleum petrolei TaxID=76116 RepID=A0ABX1MMV0_9RHOO|nr:hypothetical protein [Aromatoleum petrolei]NMF89103.1 hypothetical protein [Aromatoleum petrolei]